METIEQYFEDRIKLIVIAHQEYLSAIQEGYLWRIGVSYIIPLSLVYILGKVFPSSAKLLEFASLFVFALVVVVSLMTIIAEKYSYPVPIFDVPFIEDVTIQSIMVLPSEKALKIGGRWEEPSKMWIGKRLPKVYLNYCRYIIVTSAFGVSLLIAQIILHSLSPSILLNISSMLIGLYFVYKNYPSQQRIKEICKNFSKIN